MANAEIRDATVLPLDLPTLSRRYASGETTPSDVVGQVRAAIAARGDDGVWIAVASTEMLASAAAAVEARRRAGEALPLYGVPFAVKDNIDVVGFATTAACPAFSHLPDRSAASVKRLVEAGGIVVGKTNMDQFATGLVGVRSPYGTPRNPFDRERVVGGSSSGSAAAVALGEVSFALGTDTAGSGRVPAAFNNIVGLKPSGGIISTAGVVPACRSLDCVSVFAATCDDAASVADLMRGFDPTDPYARELAPGQSVTFRPAGFLPAPLIGVPSAAARDFLGDAAAGRAFDAAIEAIKALGASVVEIDFEPFLAAGRLLYGGAFVAQRLEAAGRLFEEQPETILEPLRTILSGATSQSALAAYAAEARLRTLRHRVASAWHEIDALMVPTAPTLPRIAEVLADPIGLNGALGMYSTFANLLELAAIAVPVAFRDDGLPAGVTLLGPWGTDARLAGIADRLHRATSTRIGATNLPLPSPSPSSSSSSSPSSSAPPSALAIAVVGAHLSGEPLNHQLTSRGGTLVRAARTAPHYRLFALPATTPPKPGLLRSPDQRDAAAIELEIWSLPSAEFGAFVAAIPAPLSIGKLDLEDGTQVSGFLCEAHATEGAEDITAFGGWRAYLGALRARR
jgi:allophanate hydrolase